jgi:hypothetical protein
MSNSISRFQDVPLIQMDENEEKNLPKENMFNKPLGNKYAAKFSEIFKSSIQDRDQKMKELYENSKEDESLNEQQKKLITKCLLGYNFAVCEKNISFPLIDFINKKKPNLTKYSKNKRINRTIVDLDDAVKRSGFDIDTYTFLLKVRRFLKIYSFIGKDDENDLDESVCLFVTALSRLSRSLSVLDYSGIWYVIMLMKQIESLTFLNIRAMKENNNIIEQIKKMVGTIITIKKLEEKRLEENK